MNCNGFRKNVYSYIDNELTAAKKAEFKEHMEKCPACRELFRETELACDAVRHLRESDAPSNLKELIMDKVKNAPVHNMADNNADSSKLYKFKWLSAAASVILILMIGVLVTNIPYRKNAGYPENKMVSDENNTSGYKQAMDTKDPMTFNSAPAYTADNSATDGKGTSKAINSMKLIFNKNFTDINIDSLINKPELRNIKHRIEDKDGMVAIIFEKKEKADGNDMLNLYRYLIDNYGAEVYEVFNEEYMDNNRTILVVN